MAYKFRANSNGWGLIKIIEVRLLFYLARPGAARSAAMLCFPFAPRLPCVRGPAVGPMFVYLYCYLYLYVTTQTASQPARARLGRKQQTNKRTNKQSLPTFVLSLSATAPAGGAATRCVQINCYGPPRQTAPNRKIRLVLRAAGAAATNDFRPVFAGPPQAAAKVKCSTMGPRGLFTAKLKGFSLAPAETSAGRSIHWLPPARPPRRSLLNYRKAIIIDRRRLGHHRAPR